QSRRQVRQAPVASAGSGNPHISSAAHGSWADVGAGFGPLITAQATGWRRMAASAVRRFASAGSLAEEALESIAGACFASFATSFAFRCDFSVRSICLLSE